MKNKVIEVQNVHISISKQKLDDYICITDIAKAKSDSVRAADVVRNWLRNRVLWNICLYGNRYIIPILKCSNPNTLKSKQGY